MRRAKINKFLSVLLALVMVLGLLPMQALADNTGSTVRVIVENTTFTTAAQSKDGTSAPAWSGTLLDDSISYTADMTMADAISAALSAHNYTAEGVNAGYITSVNGLTAGTGKGTYSGWMASLGDWFSNSSITAQTVAGGDVIRLMWTNTGDGLDLGSVYGTNDKSLTALAFSAGTLSPTFASGTTSYTLTIPSSTGSVTVTPTAANKNFQARVAAGSESLESVRWGVRKVSVSAGDTITVKCGDPSWASMNNGTYGCGGESVAAVTYTVTVAQEASAVTVSSSATSDSTHIVLTMSGALTNTAGDPNAFTVSGVASSPTVTAVSVSGTSVTLTLSTAIVSTDTNITVSYAHKGTNDLTNGTLVADFSNQAVTNKVAASDETTPYSGQTVTGTYTLSSAAQLIQLANAVNAGTSYSGSTFTLLNDIDLSKDAGGAAVSWTPIGIYNSQDKNTSKPFSGTLDGNSHTITYAITVSENYRGLFEYTSDANIKNLTVAGEISSAYDMAAGIASVSSGGSFINCVNKVNIAGNGDNYGGILGYGDGATISGCRNSGTVTGTLKCGGIIGDMFYISKSAAGSVADCTNDGVITSESGAGGIAGSIDNHISTIASCANHGAVSGNHSVGGICGYTYARSVESCTNEAAVSGTGGNVGGIVGGFGDSTIKDCTNKGKVTDTSKEGCVGGIAGVGGSSEMLNNAITGCVNIGDVKGSIKVGGLIGYLDNSAFTEDDSESGVFTFSQCYNTGSVMGVLSGSANDGYVGGLCGYVSTASSQQPLEINTCYNSGNISADALPYVGGLFGSVNCAWTSLLTVVEGCYSSGSVSGKTQVGGLAGLITTISYGMSNITIENCYSAAPKVNATQTDAGGNNTGVAGAGIGQISVYDAPSYLTVSNVFARSSGTLAGIGSDSAGIDPNDIVTLSNEQMTDSSFVTLLGGDFFWWKDISTQVATDHSDKYDGYNTLYGSYAYPILPALCGGSASTTYNVKFSGAQYFTVAAGNVNTYATTVAPGSSGGSLNFTVTSKYPGDPYDISVKSVTASGGTLTQNGEVYTLSGITADTVVTIDKNYSTLPTTSVDAAYSVAFSVNGGAITDASITVTGTDSNSTAYSPANGVYSLKAGTYNVAVSGGSGYSAVSGTFIVTSGMSIAATNTLSVSLYSNDSAKQHKLTLETGADGWYADIYNGDINIATTKSTTLDTSGYYITAFTLPDGNYTYKAMGASGSSAWSDAFMGSGLLSLSSDETVVLRFVNFSNRLYNPDNMNYTMTVTTADDLTSYTPGSASGTGGVARGWFILPSTADGTEYKYAFHTADTSYWCSSGITYLYSTPNVRDFCPMNTSDDGNFVIAKGRDVSITVPKNAELHLYHVVRFYEPAEDLAAKSTQASGDTVTYVFNVPANTEMHYELEMAGYVKKAHWYSTLDNVTNISIPLSSLTPVTNQDIKNDYPADIVLNAPDSKYIQLSSGGKYELYCFRVWQAVNTDTSNDYVDPDYKIEVLSGDSVQITNPYYAGATIQAVDGKSGVSIVRVTYGALDYQASGTDSYLYSKLWEKNTVVLVVNVNPKGSATIDTGIPLTEYDTLYFMRSINGVTRNASNQYAMYTFKPSITGGTLSSVSIHAPIGSTESWDDTAWTELTPNSDGSYTAKLTEGRSVIRVKAADGTEAYQVVKAAGLDASLDCASAQVTLKDGGFNIAMAVGDTAKLSFDGLELPIPKLGAIYNPGFPDKTYVFYSMAGSSTGTKADMESEHTQWGNGFTYPITLSYDSPDTYTLAEGKIHTTSIGAGADTHRKITRGGPVGYQSTYVSGGNSGETVNGYFSSLPDLSFTVTGTPDVGTARNVILTAPNGLSSLTVRNANGYKKTAASISGNQYTYSLVDGGGSATYTYYAERSGYETQIGTFTVSSSDVSVDLTSLSWKPITQSGTVKVDVVGYETILSAGASETISSSPTDLAAKGYVLYNHGGYTVLNALVDALNDNKAGFTCKKGVLTPTITMSDTTGTNAGWVCEVNGKAFSDYADTLVNDGDSIAFYYNPATSSSMLHAWFKNTAVSAARDGSASLTLMATPVSNDGTAATALSGATVYIDGVSWGKTDSSGTITLSSLTNLAVGDHTVTAQKTDTYSKNTLTFARAILTIAKTSGSTDKDTITVTFRLIGDTVHTASYNGYINWIKTKSYTVPKGSTVGDVFKLALDAAGMSYDSYNPDDYVAWICAPSVLGGYKLSEFSNGKNSGWMYTVNGVHPDLGLIQYTLSDGDEVIWHYVNDYTLESTYQGSVPKYVNPWLKAADVDPYAGMTGESQGNAANSQISASDDTSKTTITPTVTAASGTAAVTLGASDLSNAITSAKKNSGSTITINPTITGTASKVTIELPKSSLSSIASDTDASLTVQTPMGKVALPNSALDSIASQASGSTVTVSLNTVDTTTLTADQQKAVSGSTVYDITVLSGSSKISTFGGSSITISLPYTLKSGEDASGVTVWYMDDSGKLQQMTATYDKTTGLATFTTTHLSYYLVGYTTAWTNPFTDVTSTDWFYDAVKYVSQSSLMSGTSSTAFEPSANMTRAMLVTVLYRLDGKPTITRANSFTDVESGQWYTDAVSWASTNKIVTGYGGGLFGTDDSVTREQLAVILYNYAKYKGYDVTKTAEFTSYTDASSVDSWATDAMKWSVAEGLITGTTSTTLVPTGTATRAQVATILMRFVENVAK